jgi:hypothetical protein
MGRTQQNDRPTLILAASNGKKEPADILGARDLTGLDMERIPQELAAYLPMPSASWRRGTCSPAVDTPEGRQAIFYGTLDDIRASDPPCRDGVPINGLKTLWVVRCGDA